MATIIAKRQPVILRPNKTLTPRYPLQVCSYRGETIDVTDCGCTAYECHLHGTCSRNPGSGLRLCQECSEYTTQPLASCPPIPSPLAHTPHSDRLIITVATGDQGAGLHRITGPGQRAYAEKCRADYVVIDGLSIAPNFTMLDKFRVYQFARLYDRTLFLDADAAVRPNCPDLFEIYPSDVVAVHDDTPFIEHDKWNWQKEVREVALSQRLPVPARYRCLNSGVMLFSKQHAYTWEPPKRALPTYWCSEQHLETIKIMNDRIPWVPLPRVFNWEWWIGVRRFPDPEGLQQAFIVHGAGITGYGGSTKEREEWLSKNMLNPA